MIGRRVVVTGIGVYTPLGLNVGELGDALIDGKSSVRYVGDEYPVLKTCDVQIGSFFKEGQLTREVLGMGKLDFRHLTSYCTKVAVPAVREALDDSGILDGSDVDEIKEGMGVAIGAGFGGISEIEKNTGIYLKNGLSNLDKFLAYKTLPGATAGHVTIDYGFHGGNVSLSDACASGLTNLIYIAMNIQLGFMEAGIGGGTGDPSLLTIGGFDRMGALSKSKRNPEEISRPFDRDRDGFVVGEGAGIVVLEEFEHAKARGAKIYAEVLGYCDSSDGVNPFKPREDARYLMKSMSVALERAKVNSDEIDYINAHGTSTIEGDKVEDFGMRGVFGGGVRNVRVSSLKGNFGHLLNAAGAVELVSCLDMMDRGVIYPIKNLDEFDLDAGSDLDYFNGVQEVSLEKIMTNSIGFAGRNVSMVLGKV